MINKGRLLEDEIIYFLNNKKPCELNPNLLQMIRDLYGIVDPNLPIKCEYAIDLTKPDFVITYMDHKQYVSMKTGASTVVHKEQLSTFIKYLKEIGVSDKTIETILLYQYGDGTTDGTGKERMATDKLKYVLSDRIKEANKELNVSKELIIKVMDRVMFQGVNPNVPAANALYHGDIEYGVTVHKKQFIKYIKSKNFDWISNLHCGPLFIKPSARYADKPINNEARRHMVEISWPRLSDDMRYIGNHYDNYTPLRYRTHEE